jgi:hypothetical protein
MEEADKTVKNKILNLCNNKQCLSKKRKFTIHYLGYINT